MHYVFIYPSSGILGGIETQMVRMSHWLVTEGERVTILTISDRDWGPLLSTDVTCIALGKRFRELTYYFHARNLWNSLGLQKPDVIKSFDFLTAWIAYQLAAITQGVVVAGIYVPLPTLRHTGNNFFVQSFLRNLPPRGRVFMSPEQIDEFEQVYGQSGEFWQLPVDANLFLPAVRKPKWGKLVSIGRLSEMKEYNLYMIEVVAELCKRGYPVTWTVYGTGTYEDEMLEMVRERGLEQAVTLKGPMPYERCWQVLAEAYVFIGMGTTIVEAAMFKVPNVLALAYDRQGVTYGPIYRLPLGSVGDMQKEPPKLRVVDEIERVLNLTPKEYNEEAEHACQCVQPYRSDIAMRRFVEIVQGTPPPRRRMALFLANYLCWLPRRLERCIRSARKTAIKPSWSWLKSRRGHRNQVGPRQPDIMADGQTQATTYNS